SIRIFPKLLVALALVFLTPSSVFAQTETLEFTIVSTIPEKLELAFFSEGRQISPSNPNHVHWLNPNETRVTTLQCEWMAMVCYGAATSGGSRYWGRDSTGEEHCTSCCTMCGMTKEFGVRLTQR